MIDISTQIPHEKCLSDVEFESLLKIIKLLRVSEIRYIVKKFDLPLKGNKTKLLNDVISIFHLLKNNAILSTIYGEINEIITNKEQNSTTKLNISNYDSRFYSQPNIMQHQADPPFILGPISVLPGKSSGQFNFNYNYSNEKLVNISFLFLDGVPHQFELDCNINGFQIEISIDDPYPQPIDITDLINTNSDSNKFIINKIKTPKQMMICIREYEYLGLQMIMDQITGLKTNIQTDDFYTISKNCNHEGSFSFVDFLSNSFATGISKCPICKHEINPFDLVVLGPKIK